jgi:predicted hydrocarbon binding protein
MPGMKNLRYLQLRIIADIVLVCALGFAAPAILAPIGRNWGILLASFVAFLFAAGLLFDGLRTLQRLRKFYPSRSIREK